MTQLATSAVNNKNLFSNHYLDLLIKDNPEWEEDVTAAFNRAKNIYTRRRDWSRMDEAMLEEFLIRPILKDVLGHHFVPQAKVEVSSKRPDYAFFENEKDLNEALENKGADDLYKKALAVGDAKSWKTSLDKKVKGAKGSFEFQNPSFQIDHYLHVTPVQWGILTSGRLWRIYYKETSYKLDSYYEVDLVTILENGDIEGFKYFYLFFRLNAFIKDTSGRSFLERVKDESIAYATKLRENLQQNVYKAMKILSEGFFEWKDNALIKNEHDLKEVQENTLKLLYRLLFIFYAESLRLLDRDNPEYKKLSLESIKNDIAKRIDNRELILPVTTDYWNKLNTLFALINEGSESEKFHISKDILSIPAYNGGLFDTERNPFLHSKKVGDEYMAKAIDLLAREGKDFIDYSTLGTRQLGSIYEGLLEYRLKVAEEDLAAVKEKGHEKWLPKKDAVDKKSFDEIKAGAIYLATDKGERKATGSYYTPDYIVKYIVRNTLDPILEEKRKAWGEKGQGERPFLHDILSVRVLDPAMGSGHFLVEACEFLANRLVEAWGEARPEELESEEVAEHDVHWARREVVRHCIFGVDLNPMAVELAKLSLWLETVAANKPLTFLDHHLKVGNSLIGAQVKDLRTLPSKDKKEGAENGKQLKAPTLWDFAVKKHFEELLIKYGEFAAHPDDELKTVKQKEQEYDALQKSELNRRLHELANLWVSTYFGAPVPHDEYAEMQNEMNPKDFPDWSKWRGREWFRRAQEIAEEKRFFHWELEFPESFYEKGAPKENPGWDAVVGNPPYVRQEQLGPNKGYFELNYKSYHGVADLYVYFFEQGHQMLRKSGRFGYISSNKFLKSNYGAPLRHYLTNGIHLKQIIDFGELPVFPEAATFPAIFLTEMSDVAEDSTLFAQIRSLDFQSLDAVIQSNAEMLLPNSLEGENWSLGSEIENKIMHKVKGIGLSLKEYVSGEINFGIKTGFNEAFIINAETRTKLIAEDQKSAEVIKPLIVGDDVRKYEIHFKEKYLIFTRRGFDIEKYPAIKRHLEKFKENLMPKPKDWDEGKSGVWQGRKPGPYKWYELQDTVTYYEDFQKPKIVYPDIAITCRFCLDRQGYFPEATCFEIPVDNPYLVSILNSNLMFFYIRSLTPVLGDSSQRGRLRFKAIYLKSIPIRHISFTTPSDRRAALFEEARALYSQFLCAPDSVNKLLDFVSARLGAQPEENDVVHDLLAYLAERMIEMNKEKNAEIKGFLRWLEGEIGVPVEELANKTALKEYYLHAFDALAGALAKNKKKLKEGYDPTRREPKERLQAEFNTSVGKLAPLLNKIKTTDELIDAIVYRLYGLTEEEIKIVKESISEGKIIKNTKVENND